jgi:hypothetical protein
MPREVNARLIFLTAFKFFEQVKQWANKAKAPGFRVIGRSSLAANRSPFVLVNSTLMLSTDTSINKKSPTLQMSGF